jgi:hypothetical protein
MGTLLGDLPTFRKIFCGMDDRQLAPGQEDEPGLDFKLSFSAH